MRHAEADFSCGQPAAASARLAAAYAAARGGARGFCALSLLDLNLAADVLTASSLGGVTGGLVIAVVVDDGPATALSEPDVRRWARFAHLPLLEPAAAEEAAALMPAASALSEEFRVPVLLRLRAALDPPTTAAAPAAPATGGACRHAARRIPLLSAREVELSNYADQSPLNILERHADRRIGFVAAGPAYRQVKAAFPKAPVLKLGLSYPLPMQKIRGLAAICGQLVVVEEGAPLLEQDIRAEGIAVYGWGGLPPGGPLAPALLQAAIAGVPGPLATHDLERREDGVVVLDDAAFLGLGICGLLDLLYRRGHAVVVLRDRRSGAAPRIDFASLCQALGVGSERIHAVDDPAALPPLLQARRGASPGAAPVLVIVRSPGAGDDSSLPARLG